jgi:hypothetical protein
LHKCGDEGGEAETLDDYGTEVGDAAIWDVTDDAEEKAEVQLIVFEVFYDLVDFEMLVLYAGLVPAKAFICPAAFLLIEHWRCNGRIRNEEE